MAIPLPANVTFTISRPPGSPPGPGVPGEDTLVGHLQSAFAEGLTSTPTPAVGAPITWTHLLLVEPNVDLRDGYLGGRALQTIDTVHVPDNLGTPFRVVFVERLAIGTPHEHKRAYLDRQTPPWPTNHL